MEENEEERRRLEALYRLAQDVWKAEGERFAAAESKADRYLTLALAALGLSGFAYPTLLEGLSLSQLADIALLVLAGIFLFTVALSITSGVSALRVSRPRALPTTELADYYTTHPYDQVLVEMSRRFLAAAKHNRGLVKAKFRRVRSCYEYLVASLAAGAGLGVVFALRGL